jgi:hypothetical protein
VTLRPTFDSPDDEAAELRAQRRARLGWKQPDGERFTCACGWTSESNAAAREHATRGAKDRACYHVVCDSRDGSAVASHT